MNAITQPLVAERPAIQRAQSMKFGTELTGNGVRFRLWAPACDTIRLRIEGEGGSERVMHKLARGWFELEVHGAGPGTLYRFVLPSGIAVPDPASRFQPEDVHGPSEVIDPRAYLWRDFGWRGRPWEETVLYELHVGTFTAEGTFAAVIGKLDYLADLGVTAIELMPLADFDGRWNWGYDGVLHFAPDSTYGRPEDLKALVEAAHERGLMVFLDVVYNHFGPSGNYMSLYTPLTTDKHHTPWGAGVNFDDEGSRMVRDFVFANARYWLNEFHFDGLRFDAVHAIEDNGPKHMLQAMAEHLRGATDGRHVHLVAENSNNEAGWLTRREDLTPGLYTAQWSDAIHHALHCAVTGESFWYYADFAGDIDLLGRALADGLGYQGQHMPHEDKEKGEPSAFLPPTAFVGFVQNHDQVGNRPCGERLHMIAPPEAVRAVAAINLLAPHIPLLFMGEEWAADQPFQFFSDITDLADSIREGREREVADSPINRPGQSLSDPMAESTFAACKLDWLAAAAADKAAWLEMYRRLLQIRRAEIVPRLPDLAGYSGSYEIIGARALKVWWTLADGAVLTLIANLSPEPIDGIDLWSGRHLWLEGRADGNTLSPWSIVWSIAEQGQAAP